MDYFNATSMFFLLLERAAALNTPFGPAKCKTSTLNYTWVETCPSLTRCADYPLDSPN